jgi:hypothetical protein
MWLPKMVGAFLDLLTFANFDAAGTKLAVELLVKLLLVW